MVSDSERDDANSGGGYEGKNGPLKKGPWTIAEDLILADYVAKHGEGNWSAVQKHTELARCGKSCRLRWTNHLRPDLKKGVFTPEEERRVVELHAKMGNKWARMVPELPGRTDNEIKNFWNTRIKRRQRAGLPLYPPDVVPEPGNENQQNDTNNFSSDFMQNNNYEIPPLDFKNLEFNQQHLYPPHPLDISSSSRMPQNRGVYYPTNAFLLTMPSKRLRGSDGLFPSNAAFGSFLPNGSQYQNAQPFPMGSSTYANQGANISSSAKLELPSFQSEMGGWSSPSAPVASLDSVNILAQTSKTEQNQSCDLSPRRSGLLEEVLFEAKTMNNSTNASANASDIAVTDVFDNLSSDIFDAEWETDSGLLSLPMVFGENSLDEYEHQPIVTAPGGKSEAISTSLFPAQSVNEAETSNQNIISRPDELLGSNYFGSMHTTPKDHVMLNDGIGTALGDDLSSDFPKAETSLSQGHQPDSQVHQPESQGHQPDSCAWDNAMSSAFSLVPQFFDEM